MKLIDVVNPFRFNRKSKKLKPYQKHCTILSEKGKEEPEDFGR